MKAKSMEKIKEIIANDILSTMSEEKINTMVEQAVKDCFNPSRMYNQTHLGNIVEQKINDEFIRQYVNKNFDELASNIDMTVFKKLSTMRITKEFLRGAMND